MHVHRRTEPTQTDRSATIAPTGAHHGVDDGEQHAATAKLTDISMTTVQVSACVLAGSIGVIVLLLLASASGTRLRPSNSVAASLALAPELIISTSLLGSQRVFPGFRDLLQASDVVYAFALENMPLTHEYVYRLGTYGGQMGYKRLVSWAGSLVKLGMHGA